jgi:hypothetical protein
MKKLILLALVCTGFAVTTPLTAQALDSDKIAQYERNQYPDNQYRNRNRQFSVYYRNRNDRQWTFEGYHNNRRDARQAANRLERRGYRTYVQVSRRVNSGMNRG